MQKKITETTATYGLGSPYQSKLLEVPAGAYAGRRVALMQSAANDIVLAWSDSPATTWSDMQEVATDAVNGSLDCCLDTDGNIYLVYTELSTSYLVHRKLTFSSGAWSVGSKTTIYSGAMGLEPALAIESGGKLWVTYSLFASPNRTIYVKSSDDGGATWGSGAADAGDQISATVTFAWSRPVVAFNAVHVIYNDQDTAMSIRSQPLAGGGWSAAYDIATGSGFSESFDVAVSADGRLGVLITRDQLYYREFDGSNWGALVILDTVPVVSPQLLFLQNVPVSVYLTSLGGQLQRLMYTDRQSGTFSDPAVLDARLNHYDSVLLYDASGDSYEDLTTAAASSTEADVYHASSGCLLKDEGDTLYLGMDVRFRSGRATLSTVGSGGSLLFSYWDGVNWQAFTPANGSNDLSAAAEDLLFWADFYDIPDDWQKCEVDSLRRFWVKIEVVSGFATGPVGSRLTAVSEVDMMIFRR